MTRAETVNLSQVARGAILQDAYWYAERAEGGDDMFNGEYSPSTALRLALKAAHRAGLRMGSRGLRLKHAAGIKAAVVAFAEAYGLDARTGEPLRCAQCDKSLTKHQHEGCYWTRETDAGRKAVAAVSRAYAAQRGRQ